MKNIFRPAQIISHINRNNLVDSRTTRIYKKLEFNKVFLVKLSIGRISALAFKMVQVKEKKYHTNYCDYKSYNIIKCLYLIVEVY